MKNMVLRSQLFVFIILPMLLSYTMNNVSFCNGQFLPNFGDKKETISFLNENIDIPSGFPLLNVVRDLLKKFENQVMETGRRIKNCDTRKDDCIGLLSQVKVSSNINQKCAY